MSIHASAVVDQATAPATSVAKDKVMPALFASALAVALLYGAAFSPMEALHNAAHDGRHSAGFPCH
ncbi:CbtB domain-containing protein [Rugamonas sp. CCM 8940]|uniref:CbtB domain-containing protein n=1 Tax=Rugamonas sp. CCM 8940 TaxID=2765359 RepID=UPI0018F6AF45|nr:CbtB domain-containing protein [Rugamonas sp. CCM 8940]MBJ7312494.1 CbtB-domain containing protein [Rugamonas sp. CCM 8940]